MGTHDERVDTHSGLAYAFLDLVERHRPPAILLENVPGLLSSNGGRDFGALQARLAQLGYVGAYRILDARHFGVPQRRRRVFILALHADRYPDSDGPGSVLAVGTRCRRHPPTGVEAGPEPAERARTGIDIAGGLTRRYGKGINSNVFDGAIVSPATYAGGVRAPDGLAGRLDDRPRLAATPEDDPPLPLGLDSHRYRCCGNGVVSSVSEWIGLRLAAYLS